jgi:hypothetical protein
VEIRYEQTGHYFRDIYTNLISRLAEFPDDDPSPNLRECIEKPNFVRAEMLARQHNLPTETLIQIQELTVLQYLIDFGNDQGLARVMHIYQMTPMELDRIVDLIKQEEYYPCFSFSRSTEHEGISAHWNDPQKYYDQKIKGTKKWYHQFYEKQ